MNIKYFCGNSRYENVHYELSILCHNYTEIVFSMCIYSFKIFLKVK